MNRQSAQRIYDLAFDLNNYEGRKIAELKFPGFIHHKRFVLLYLKGMDLEMLDENGDWKLVNPTWDKSAQYRVYRPTVSDIRRILDEDEDLRHLPQYLIDEVLTTVHTQMKWFDDDIRSYASISRPRNAGRVALTKALYLVMNHYKMIDPIMHEKYHDYFTKYNTKV